MTTMTREEHEEREREREREKEKEGMTNARNKPPGITYMQQQYGQRAGDKDA